jgi:hypothetical protein
MKTHISPLTRLLGSILAFGALATNALAADLFVVNQPVEFKSLPANVSHMVVGCSLHPGAGAQVGVKNTIVGGQTNGNYTGVVTLTFTEQDIDPSMRNTPHLITQVRCGSYPMLKVTGGLQGMNGSCIAQASSIIQQGASCKDASAATIP